MRCGVMGGCALLSLVLVMGSGCGDTSSPSDPGDTPTDKPVRLVSIDIDDVFLASSYSGDPSLDKVKMTEADVKELIALSDEINRRFGGGFAFSLGYNSGYYDSLHAGDRAFVANAPLFRWFNHLPRHEHVVESSLSEDTLTGLFKTAYAWEDAHGVAPFRMRYCVTHKHEGLWPPYAPLYNTFEKYGVTATAYPELDRPAVYGTVRIMQRSYCGLGSYICSFKQLPRSKLSMLTKENLATVLSREATVFGMHQANFAVDRLANEMIRSMIDSLSARTDYTIVFLPSDTLIQRYFASRESK